MPAHLLMKNNELIDASKKIIKKYNLKLALIGIRENHPRRHRFLPLDYFKKPIEVVIIPDDISTTDIRNIASDFAESEKQGSQVRIEVNDYLSETALFISKKPWYYGIRGRLRKAYKS